MTLILSGSDGLSDVDGSAATPAIRGTDANTGIFFPAADQVAITTGGTQRAVVDASGNIGIGTSSPAAPLHVNGASGSAAFIVGNTGDTTRLEVTATTNVGAMLDITDAGNNRSMMFAISGTERARIDSSGNLLVGTTTALATTTHSFVAAGSGNGAPMASRNSATGAGKYWTFGPDSSNNYRVFNNGGTGVYVVDGATAWTATSDERLKDIIEPISNASNKVSTLRAVIGKYKTDEEGTRRSFLIAQDVQSVLPEAVHVQNDEIGTLGIQYSDVIPLLVAAIKEQQAIIESLKARLDAANL